MRSMTVFLEYLVKSLHIPASILCVAPWNIAWRGDKWKAYASNRAGWSSFIHKHIMYMHHDNDIIVKLLLMTSEGADKISKKMQTIKFKRNWWGIKRQLKISTKYQFQIHETVRAQPDSLWMLLPNWYMYFIDKTDQIEISWMINKLF